MHTDRSEELFSHPLSSPLVVLFLYHLLLDFKNQPHIVSNGIILMHHCVVFVISRGETIAFLRMFCHGDIVVGQFGASTVLLYRTVLYTVVRLQRSSTVRRNFVLSNAVRYHSTLTSRIVATLVICISNALTPNNFHSSLQHHALVEQVLCFLNS
jgi:hypothetical protein